MLHAHALVRQAVVTLDHEPGRSPNLIALLVFAPGKQVTSSELRQFLLSKLPDYMVPLGTSHCRRLPLDANGKVNRRALPKPTGDDFDPQRDATPPVSSTEEVLVALWSEVLGLESVGTCESWKRRARHPGAHVARRWTDIAGIPLGLPPPETPKRSQT